MATTKRRPDTVPAEEKKVPVRQRTTARGKYEAPSMSDEEMYDAMEEMGMSREEIREFIMKHRKADGADPFEHMPLNDDGTIEDLQEGVPENERVYRKPDAPRRASTADRKAAAKSGDGRREPAETVSLDTNHPYNFVAVQGFVAADPELAVTAGGKPYTKFRMGVRVGKEQIWWTYTSWEGLAEEVEAMVRQGDTVWVWGRLNSWTTKNDEQVVGVTMDGYKMVKEAGSQEDN